MNRNEQEEIWREEAHRFIENDRSIHAPLDLFMMTNMYIAACKKRQEEIDELKRVANFCYCVFCADSIERTWEELRAHMLICRSHPVFKLRELLKQAKPWMNAWDAGDPTHPQIESWLRQYDELMGEENEG